MDEGHDVECKTSIEKNKFITKMKSIKINKYQYNKSMTQSIYSIYIN